VKRGILFHGKPGTGKTHTIRYLTRSCPGVAVFFLNGENMGALAPTCSLARMLEPSMVVIEDIDLIARELGGLAGRSHLHPEFTASR
jgi:SpoVK/Ycf46/Vps4 family AAA+-type ATPase